MAVVHGHKANTVIAFGQVAFGKVLAFAESAEAEVVDVKMLCYIIAAENFRHTTVEEDGRGKETGKGFDTDTAVEGLDNKFEFHTIIAYVHIQGIDSNLYAVVAGFHILGKVKGIGRGDHGGHLNRITLGKERRHGQQEYQEQQTGQAEQVFHEKI